MEIFCIIVIFLMFGIAMCFILRSQFQKLYEQKYNEKYEELLKNGKEEIRREAIKESQEILSDLEELKEKANSKEAEVYRLDRSIKEKTEFNSSLQKIREEELDKLIEKEKEKRLLQLEHDVEEWAESAQDCANFQFEETMSNYQAELDKKYRELNDLYAEVNEYRDKRRAINEEIMRSRAINEQQDFYRVQLDNDSKNDMELINSIRPRLKKFATLNKLIYDNYISKPAKEMVKRVLSGKDPSGIYKVTNIETKEVYIGKSTTIASRWINHIKSAEGLDGVADSQFQRALRDYGVENFTWELLEEVPKEKLTEREKYWIQFFDTVHYGYNMKVG